MTFGISNSSSSSGKTNDVACAAEWNELEFIREWILSLSMEDLLQAMTFSTVLLDDVTTDELDLLKEMIRVQPPPPVPIHPRAIPRAYYQPATFQGLTDGRCEEIRRDKLRFTHPRWFQLFSRRSSFGSNSTKKHNKIPTNNKIKNCTSSTGFYNRNNHCSSYNHHDIIYKSFTSPWGEPLTVGCTLDQERADQILLRHTRISYNHTDNDHRHPYKCAVTCSFSTATDINNPAITSSRDLLQLLKVTSRGHFLSQPYISKSSQSSPSSSDPCYHFAPWFHPQQEWFSLPKYLTSRFEVAIRNSFLLLHNNAPTTINQRKLPTIATATKNTKQSSNNSNNSRSTTYKSNDQNKSSTTMALLEHAITTWPSDTLHSCLLKAMKLTLSQHLVLYSYDTLIRDTALFQLFNISSYKNRATLSSSSSLFSSASSRLVLFESLSTIPLIEFGTQRDQLRLLFLSQLCTTFLQTIETQLLVNHDVSAGNNMNGNNGQQPRSKSRRKKKKKQATKQHVTRDKKDKIMKSSTKEKSSVSSSSGDEECLLNCSYWSSPSNTQTRQTSFTSKGYTRSTILALTIIEDVMEHVFLHVDAEETKKNNKQFTTSQGNYLHSTHNLPGKDETYCTMNPNNLAAESMHRTATSLPPEVTLLPSSTNEVTASASTNGVVEEDFYLPSYLDPIYEPHDVAAKDWNNHSSRNNTIMGGVSLDLSGSFDGWKNLLKPSVVGRDHLHHHPKLFAEFLRQHDERPPIASSTAASVASSVSEPDVEDIPPQPPSHRNSNNNNNRKLDSDYYPTTEDETTTSWIPDHEMLLQNDKISNESCKATNYIGMEQQPADQSKQGDEYNMHSRELSENNEVHQALVGSSTEQSICASSSQHITSSHSPPLPPQQQPIKLSLADLGKLRISPKTIPLKKSWSRGNLNQSTVTAPVGSTFAEDYLRKELSNPLGPSPAKVKMVNTPPRTKINHHLGDCAVSESGMEGDRNMDWCNNNSINNERMTCHDSNNNNERSMTCDHHRQRVDHQLEDENILREELNAYRDLALTLGAEVSNYFINVLLRFFKRSRFVSILLYALIPFTL